MKNSSATIFPIDTVLIALYGATIGASSILKIPAATNQACGAILPSHSFLPDFLYYYVVANREKLVEAGIGGAQPNISGQILKDLKIPLPDLDTQRHIAAVLDKADALRQKDRQLLAYYEALPQAVFMEMFGDEQSIKHRYEAVNLCEVADIVSGVTKNTKQTGTNYIDVPYMRVANVLDGLT